MASGDDQRIPDQDVDAVLDRAMELQADAEDPQASVRLSELQRAAEEVGVHPGMVSRAAQELAASRRLRRRLLVGSTAVALLGGLVWWLAVPARQGGEMGSAPASAPPAPTAAGHARAPGEAGAPPNAEREPAPGLAPAPAVAAGVPPTPAEELGAVEAVAGDAAAAAHEAMTGSWQLVGWVTATGQPTEVPAAGRSDAEASAEVWHFSAGGRLRRTIGDDFAMGAQWRVLGSTPTPERLEWMGIDAWWLVALDQVRLAALPTDVRPREWALVGEDGSERVIFYLGQAPKLGPKAMGVRCVRGQAEGARR